MAARRMICLVLAVALLAGIIGCTPAPTGEGAGQGGSTVLEGLATEEPGEEDAAPPGLALRVDAGGRPGTLDPARCATATEYTLANHLFQGLYALREQDGAAVPLPAAAHGHTMVLHEDGTATYTFALREDALWSDGVQVTAGDFEYAWKRLASLTVGQPTSGLMTGVAGAEDIRRGALPPEALAAAALDDFTFAVTLETPDESFPARTAAPGLCPVRQDAVERAESGDWSLDAALFCGNGPYQLAERGNAELILTQAAPEGEGPAQITFVLGEDGPALAEAFENDTLQLLQTDLTEGEAILDVQTLALVAFDTPPPGTRDETALWQALLASLNVDALAPMVPDALGGAMPEAAAPAHDPEAAVTDFATAGFGAGAVWPGGVALAYENAAQEPLAQALAASWAQTLGIPIEPVPAGTRDPEAYPYALHLASQGFGSLSGGPTTPLYTWPHAYALSEDILGTLYTRETGFYFGDCQSRLALEMQENQE